MRIHEITDWLEAWAPLHLQESYDNAGLLVGNKLQEVHGVLISLDVTEKVIEEAIQKNCNLIISHHPIIFKGIKRINGSNLVERCIIKAIQHGIALYAIHTNLDNVQHGVNQMLAQRLGLTQTQVLSPRSGEWMKLITYVPLTATDQVRQALFDAGAGHIGKYDECSYSSEGVGTFRPSTDANPHVGKIGQRHYEPEHRIEVLLHNSLQVKMVYALRNSHPYEEPAFDLVPLANESADGSGMVGWLAEPMDSATFLAHIKQVLPVHTIRYTPFHNRIHQVAVCGGAGSFLLSAAKQSGVQAFITSDIKYHEFFEAENQLLFADIGHYESEIFTKEWIQDHILKKFPTFAVLLSEINTNPIKYY